MGVSGQEMPSGLEFEDLSFPSHKASDFSLFSFNPEHLENSSTAFKNPFADFIFLKMPVVSSAYCTSFISLLPHFIPCIALLSLIFNYNTSTTNINK